MISTLMSSGHVWPKNAAIDHSESYILESRIINYMNILKFNKVISSFVIITFLQSAVVYEKEQNVISSMTL